LALLFCDILKKRIRGEVEIVIVGRSYNYAFYLFFEKNNVELIEEKTVEAVKLFNRLFKQGKNVSAGFHLSC